MMILETVYVMSSFKDDVVFPFCYYIVPVAFLMAVVVFLLVYVAQVERGCA